MDEVGYLLRLDTKTNDLYADYFWGESPGIWMSLGSNPYGHALGANEMIIGFVHTHPGKGSESGPHDRSVISSLSLGEYRWTNVPKMADFTIQRGWGDDKIKSVQVLHNNPRTIDRMYFGVMYSRGFDSFSWKLTTSIGLKNLYYNIYIFGDMTTEYNFKTFPGIDFKPKKKR